MTTEAGKQKAQTAKDHHENGQYLQAAKSYTTAAYEYLGVNGLEHTVSAARGLRNLAVGATCLRYSKGVDRSRNLCWQGVYVSKAVAESALDRPPASHPHDHSERGVWYEFEGDFKMIGNLPDAVDAYDRAEAVYLDAGNPPSVSLDQFHMSVAALTKLLVRGTGVSTEELHSVLQPESTLSDWIAFKRWQIPEALDRLDDSDTWTYVF